jgi:hypothetical protein
MTHFGSTAFALVLLLSSGCDGARDVDGSPSVPAGAMSYRGYDDLGRLIVTGWIDLDIPNSQDGSPVPPDFDGTWSFRALANTDRIGPQSGSGVLVGWFTDNGVVVELQPGQVDNNVRLVGTLTAGGPAPMRYEGDWRWMTLTGVRATGTFRASQ